MSGCADFEEFAAKVLNNYSEEFVSLWVLANLETSKKAELPQRASTTTFEEEKELLSEEFAELDFWEHVDESFFNAVSYLSKKLWTIEGEDPHYKPKIERTNFR